jgi:multiple sugar transport system ATP-binding protein
MPVFLIVLQEKLFPLRFMMEVFKMAEVQLENISKSFGNIKALSDINLTIPDGSFVVMLGPTGAGKTTTLRVIAGLDKPDTGSIKIGGQDVNQLTPAQRNIAMVFQQYSLYPHMSVRDNLAFPLRSPVLNVSKEQIKQQVDQVAEVLQISHKLDNKATELSGGEMQRVSIGRALVRNPLIYLMDEPLSSLDAKLRADLRVELKRIHAELAATLLYVTHDQIEAMTMASHVGVLDDGNLVQFGTPREIYEDPNSTYVAARLGQPRINLLPAGLLDEKMPERAHTVGLRPENIIQSKSKGKEAQVIRIEHLGDQTRLHLKLMDHDIITLTQPDTNLASGEVIKLAAEKPIFFDAAGMRIR